MRGPCSTPINPLTGSFFHADPHTVQLGSHNSASTTQSGNSNHSSIVQIGHGWSQSVTQTGSQQGFSSTQISTPAGSGQWSTSAGGNTVVLQLGAPQPSQPVP